MAVTATLTHSAAVADSTSATIGIGAAAADRVVVVVIMAEGPDTAVATEATINSVAATAVAAGVHSGTQVVQIWYAAVPTTTGNVTFTCDKDYGSICGFDVWRLIGSATTSSDNDFDPPTVSDVDSITLDAVTVPTDGIGIYGAINDSVGTNITWTNVDNTAGESNYEITGNQLSTAIVTTAGTPSVTAAGAVDDMAGCAIAFGPSSSGTTDVNLHGTGRGILRGIGRGIG